MAGDGSAVPAGHWTEQLFLRHKEVFRAIHGHGWPSGVEQGQQLARVFERFGIESGARILDAPCGIGRHATRLARLGCRVVGADLFPLRKPGKGARNAGRRSPRRRIKPRGIK